MNEKRVTVCLDDEDGLGCERLDELVEEALASHGLKVAAVRVHSLEEYSAIIEGGHDPGAEP